MVRRLKRRLQDTGTENYLDYMQFLDAHPEEYERLEEEYSEYALKLRDYHIGGHIIIVVPSLLEHEVLNALKHSGM